MYKHLAVSESNVLSAAAIADARKALEERSEKTRLSGFEAINCATHVRNFYHPGSPSGKQIYMSYSGDELLDIIIGSIQKPRRVPDWDKVHYIYKLYLAQRFGNLAQAKAKARNRMRQIELWTKWPPDWPKRVSPEPLYAWMRERNRDLPAEHRDNIEKICRVAKETGVPPELSSPECLLLGKISNYKKALEMMNIPPLNKGEMRFMERYWKEAK